MLSAKKRGKKSKYKFWSGRTKKSEMKNALENTENRADHMEERIIKLKDKNLEIIQVEEERELRTKNKLRNSTRTI